MRCRCHWQTKWTFATDCLSSQTANEYESDSRQCVNSCSQYLTDVDGPHSGAVMADVEEEVELDVNSDEHKKKMWGVDKFTAEDNKAGAYMYRMPQRRLAPRRAAPRHCTGTATHSLLSFDRSMRPFVLQCTPRAPSVMPARCDLQYTPVCLGGWVAG